MNDSALNIYFSPIVSDLTLIIFAITGTLLFITSLLVQNSKAAPRFIMLTLFILILSRPSIIEEQRKPVPDTAILIIDQSQSQNNGDRQTRTEAARQYVEQQLSQKKNIDLRIIEAPSDKALAEQTDLFSVLNTALTDVPPARRAGVIILTDGRVHDAPDHEKSHTKYGPVHVLLSGEQNEYDRRIKITEAPSYGIVGQDVILKYTVEDSRPNVDTNFTQISTRINGNDPQNSHTQINTPQELRITIPHAGQNIIHLKIPVTDKEITAANNEIPLIINGIRDRLKVLLVSGQPHAGGRMWRNFLKADPGVDLVHFTILREPHKLDATPQNELALIAFPFRELFEIKLYDFDLVIFDRYRLNRILPPYYFSNIAKYVRDGGALLEASGPDYAGPDSLYTTALKSIFPARPTGSITKQTYKPELTQTGFRHPVTEKLSWKGIESTPNQEPAWGAWLHQVDLQNTSGLTLMNGAKNHPLLVLDRVEKGRVAQIASDQIWLWGRGYDGGGPQSSLLRRLAHWLMKEPELEENALHINAEGNDLIITRRTINETSNNITLTKPDGTKSDHILEKDENGLYRKIITAEQLGIYGVTDGQQERFAVVGSINPRELQDVTTSAEPLHAIAQNSGGGIKWLTETPNPAIRTSANTKNHSGKNWLSLRENNDFIVTGVKQKTILSPLIGIALLLLSLIGLWFIESRSKA